MEILKVLQEALTQNLGMKMGALGIAILMFSLVHGAEDMQGTVYVDVLVQPPTDSVGMMLVSEIPDRVKVTLRGSRSRINAMRSENLPPVEVRPRSVEETQYYFAEDEVKVPPGVAVSQIAPASIELTWTKRVTRTLPVEVVIQGELEKGLRFGGPPSPQPSEVRVEGPELALEGLKRIRTVAIDAFELTEGLNRRELGFMAPPPHSKFSAAAVLVTVPVVRDLEERVISKLRVHAVGAKARSIRPKYVQVRVKGERPQIRSVDLSRVRAAVELGAIAPTVDSATLPVVLLGVPASVEVVSIVPAEVTVQR